MPAEEYSMSFKIGTDLLNQLSRLDWLVFIGVNILSFSLLIFIKKRNKNVARDFDWLDYLLMGRKLSLPFFVASLVATWYGGIFGVTRISFESGIFNFITQGFFWYLSYFVFAIFLVNKIKQSNAVTLAELVGQKFGPRSAKLAAIFNFFNVVPVVYTISLGILFQSLFHIPFNLSCAIGLCIVFLYTAFGGMRAVVLTDVFQFGLMFIGVGAVAVFSVAEYGGLGFLQNNLPSEHFSITGGHSLGETLAWGFIAFSTLVDPNFYHRVFAAESAKVAKKGILISIVFWFIFDLATTTGGMYARAVIPDASSENAYLLYSLNLLPDGLKGLFLGGIVACVISTLDSYVFTASNTLLYDLFPKNYHLKKRNHVFSNIFVCILALVLANAFDGNIKSVWKTLGSYSAACLLFPVILSQFFKTNMKDGQFLFSCSISVIGVSIWRNVDFGTLSNLIDDLYIGVLLSSLSVLTFLFLNKKTAQAD